MSLMPEDTRISLRKVRQKPNAKFQCAFGALLRLLQALPLLNFNPSVSKVLEMGT